MTDKAISDYYRKLNKQRKVKAGGFKDPKVRKKAWETRKRNILDAKNTNRQSRQTIQPVDKD